MTTPYHVPVMLNASIEALNLDGDGGAQIELDGRDVWWWGDTAAILAKLGADARRLLDSTRTPRRRQMRWTTNSSPLVAANFRFTSIPSRPPRTAIEWAAADLG